MNAILWQLAGLVLPILVTVISMMLGFALIGGIIALFAQGEDAVKWLKKQEVVDVRFVLKNTWLIFLYGLLAYSLGVFILSFLGLNR